MSPSQFFWFWRPHAVEEVDVENEVGVAVEVEVGAEVVAPRRRKSLGLLVWVLRSKVAAGFYSNELKKKKKKLKPNSRSRCLEVEVKIRQANMAPKNAHVP